MRFVLALLAAFVLSVSPATADDLTRALNRAIALFDAAAPQMGEAFGVDPRQYRDALVMGKFERGGQTISLYYEEKTDPAGHCGRFAAYTMLPPRDGVVRLVVCPRFFSPGADALRTLTVLHELVHAVTDANECRAMAYAARIQQRATGAFTPVDAYWQANNCAASAFSLP
ncbi:hypothetical protein [Devosia sp. SD17-2]|jgi:hypothetical protein|uniref:hypothetical protein n=1 Tax=Devosia sp. SD17-2 TaxID=2976459 RepID=UPI0023D85B7C|nr:hypothetical protein [Devosia sp. SD17-2]WEJ33240.1 hypothetical protein NYQ88_20715 [Devosia sp. SD17-2]